MLYIYSLLQVFNFQVGKENNECRGKGGKVVREGGNFKFIKVGLFFYRRYFGEE